MRPHREFGVAPPPAHCAYHKAFTLIELLVVISVVALLMAILMPCLQRARNQAKAVACQGQLRQWGVIFSVYADEHEGRLFPNGLGPRDIFKPSPTWTVLKQATRAFNPYFDSYYKMLLCPAAVKLDISAQSPVHGGTDPEMYGDAYRPYQGPDPWNWGLWRLKSPTFLGSYGINAWFMDYPWQYEVAGSPFPHRSFYWEGATWKHLSQVPVFLDCRYLGTQPVDGLGVPPAFETEPPHWEDLSLVVMNRHSAGINSLFLDWSVRKVGIKEPWTLKWHKEYDIVGPWTKRGGVEPEDWPQWMRRFKDY